MASIIKFNRTIRKSGRSAMIAIPPDVIRSLKWNIGDDVKISVTPDRAILIEKVSIEK
jgi:antitoxin component of MazEF toxin-antitoxin module